MSIINDVVMKHIFEYDKIKTGKWDKPELPPDNTFSRSELYLIGTSIVSALEGILSDKILKP